MFISNREHSILLVFYGLLRTGLDSFGPILTTSSKPLLLRCYNGAARICNKRISYPNFSTASATSSEPNFV
jgi:hypothetical protein